MCGFSGFDVSQFALALARHIFGICIYIRLGLQYLDLPGLLVKTKGSISVRNLRSYARLPHNSLSPSSPPSLLFVGFELAICTNQMHIQATEPGNCLSLEHSARLRRRLGLEHLMLLFHSRSEHQQEPRVSTSYHLEWIVKNCICGLEWVGICHSQAWVRKGHISVGPGQPDWNVSNCVTGWQS